MTPLWLEPTLILFAFGALPLGIVAFFGVRAYVGYVVRREVLGELMDLLALACRRNLPFPLVLEGFATSLEVRGASSPTQRLVPGRRGRLSVCATHAYAFAAEVREGGLPHALGGAAAAALVPLPFRAWLEAGYARGSLPRTLEAVRDQLRFDARQQTWYLPLFAYLVLGLLFSLGGGAILSKLWAGGVFDSAVPPAVPGWLPPLLSLGWFALVLVGIPLSASGAGARNRVLDRLPGVGPARRLRASANRLRLLESSLRAGLSAGEALGLLAEAGDAEAERAAARVAEGEDPLRALGFDAPTRGGAPFVEVVGALAAEHERLHAAGRQALALATLPLGLAIMGLSVFGHHHSFFSNYFHLLQTQARPW